MTVTVDDVDKLSSTAWKNLSLDRKVALLEDAKSERETLYSDRMSRLPTLDGDEDVFIKNLAAHKFELAEGGEAQSESGEGGSTSYQGGGAGEEYLKLTRYGKTALRHVYSDSSIAAVRSW